MRRFTGLVECINYIYTYTRSFHPDGLPMCVQHPSVIVSLHLAVMEFYVLVEEADGRRAVQTTSSRMSNFLFLFVFLGINNFTTLIITLQLTIILLVARYALHCMISVFI